MRLAASAVFVALLVAGTWVVASRQQTPQQAAATASPPLDTPVLVTVERRSLEKSVVFRCSGVTPFQITVGAPTLPAGFSPIVTNIGIGSSGAIKEGAVIFEVSHRPVIAVQGQFPAYRDLQPGDKGKDVLQLQRALRRLGLSPEVDGSFGSRTQASIRRLYESKGYAPAYEDETASRGPRVPLGEIIFVPEFPAQGKVLVKRYQHVNGPLADLSAGKITIRGTVPAADGGGLKPGLTVAVADDIRGSSFEGKISSIGQPEPVEQFGEGRTVTIAPLKSPAIGTLGADLRCSSVVAQTAESALVVPLTAILSDSSGETYVLVWDGEGPSRRVRVAIGLSATTHVEILPKQPGEIEAGDRVVVEGRG